MKTIYLLFVVLTEAPVGCDIPSKACNQQGYETMLPISDVKHNTILSCKVEKAQHKEVINKIAYFCGDETKYFNKQQTFF